MKKTLFIGLIGLVVCSCMQEGLIPSGESQNSGKTFILSAESPRSNTKAGIAEYGSFYWTTGDQVALFTTKNQFKMLSLTDGSGMNVGTFKGQLDDGEDPAGSAIFPGSIAGLSGETPVVTLPSEFAYVDNSEYGQPPMIANIVDGTKASFRHLCGMLRFTIQRMPKEAAYVRLTSPDSQLSGQFSLVNTEGVYSIATQASESNRSVEVSFSVVNYDRARTFSIPIPVGVYNSLTIEILGSDKSVLWQKTSTSSTEISPASLIVLKDISVVPVVIDLGLPSGTLWADRNVGASSPEGYGGLYAWGETETKDAFTQENYKFYESTYHYTKYVGNDEYELEECDDAASVAYGSNWRIPSKDQLQELLDNCTYEAVTLNGVRGTQFTGTNGKSLFLPWAGTKYEENDHTAGNYTGRYWSRTTAAITGGSSAHWLELSSGDPKVKYVNRCWGISVRPVYIDSSPFQLQESSMALFINETCQLNLVVKNISETIVWESLDKSVATISSSGLVTGIAEGVTTIVVRTESGAKIQSCTVRVSQDITESIKTSFVGGAIVSINGVIRSGSTLSYQLNNNSQKAIKITGVKLINGESGVESSANIEQKILFAGESVTYTLTVGFAGIQSPICRYVYEYEGREYNSDCSDSV